MNGVYNKQYPMATKFSHQNCWGKLKMMITFVEVKGQQR